MTGVPDAEDVVALTRQGSWGQGGEGDRGMGRGGGVGGGGGGEREKRKGRGYLGVYRLLTDIRDAESESC